MNIIKKLFGTTHENPGKEQVQQAEKDFDVLKYDGLAALRQNQLDYAIKCFVHALSLKDDDETRDYLSQAYIRGNQLAEAMDELSTLSAEHPDNVEILLRMARVAFMQEDYAKMMEVSSKASELSPNDPRVAYASAQAFIGRGNPVVAVAMLTKAIALSQNKRVEAPSADVAQDKSSAAGQPSADSQPFFDAYLLRGQTLLKMGDVQGASADASFLTEHLPEEEEPLLLQAGCLAAEKRNEEAEAVYNKVIELNPFSVEAFRGRGAVRLAAGNRKGVAEDAQEVLTLDPDQAQVSGHYHVEGTENIAEIIAKLKAKREQERKNVSSK